MFESGEDPLILLLDGVSDVRNFGAIARSAECAGVHAIVIPSSGSAAINADAIKTSAGALHRIPVCRHRDMPAVARFLQESGLRLIAATEKACDSLHQSDMTGPVGIIMGGEERGVSYDLIRHADALVIHSHERHHCFFECVCGSRGYAVRGASPTRLAA